MELRNFIKEEFTCDGKNCFKKMSPKLLKMLDDAREFADIPFTITSSWRSKAHNMEVGGNPNSAHLRGTAVDISCFISATGLSRNFCPLYIEQNRHLFQGQFMVVLMSRE